ncbi:hypothetical protein GOODEAATRI_030337, partial [Goodea atripinnis]
LGRVLVALLVERRICRTLLSAAGQGRARTQVPGLQGMVRSQHGSGRGEGVRGGGGRR